MTAIRRASTPRAAAPAPAPARVARPGSLRLGAFAALGIFGGAALGARIVRPGAGGDLLGLFADRRRRRRASPRRATEALTARVRRAAAWPRSCFAAARPRPARRGRAALACCGLPLGRPRVGHRAGRSVALPAYGALPRHRRVGADAILVAAARAAGARRAAGLLAARAPRRPASRSRPPSRSARSTRCRSSSTGPSHPYLDGILFSLLLGAFLWLERRALTGREVAGRGACIGARRRRSARRSLAPRLDAPSRGSTTRRSPRRCRAGKTTDLHLEPQLRPAGLAARRARDRCASRPAARRTEGGQPRRLRRRELAPGHRRRCRPGEDTEFSPRHPSWTQTIQRRRRGLASRQFLAAGDDDASSTTPQGRPAGDAGTFETAASRCAAATPTTRWSTCRARAPSSSSARAPTTRLLRWTPLELRVRLPGPPAASTSTGARAQRPGALRAVGQRRPGARRARPAASRSSSRRPGTGRLAVRPRVRPGPAAARRHDRRPTTTCARCSRASSADARYTESPPSPGGSRRSTPSCFATTRATASSSPARWRCCCGWAACRRASRRASRPARCDGRNDYVIRDLDAHSLGRGLLPAARLGDLRPDARPTRRRARSRPTRRR